MTALSQLTSRRRTLLGLALGCYVANVALGTAVAVRVVDTRPIHWVHHALFTVTISSTAASLVLHFAARDRRMVPLLVAMAALASVTRTSGRQRSHPVVALMASPALVTTLLMREN